MKVSVFDTLPSVSRETEENITGLCMTCANVNHCIFREGIQTRIVFCEEYILDADHESDPYF